MNSITPETHFINKLTVESFKECNLKNAEVVIEKIN